MEAAILRDELWGLWGAPKMNDCSRTLKKT